MLKKLRELLKQKGQGTVEYALILGFVAVLAVYLLTGSNLTKDLQKNIKNADDVSVSINNQYFLTKGEIPNVGGASIVDDGDDN